MTHPALQRQHPMPETCPADDCDGLLTAHCTSPSCPWGHCTKCGRSWSAVPMPETRDDAGTQDVA